MDGCKPGVFRVRAGGGGGVGVGEEWSGNGGRVSLLLLKSE